MNPILQPARFLLSKYRFLRLARLIGSSDWSKILSASSVAIPPAAHSTPDGALELPELGLTIKPRQAFALEGYGYLRSLKSHGFTFRVVDSEVEACGQGVCVHLRSVSECYIMHEIFCSKTYDVQVAPGALVIDIGMNVGFASLFFAANLPGARIESFELFPTTFQRAQKQLAMNPSLSGNISAHNFGLWSRDDARTLVSHPDVSGCNGLWGSSSGLKGCDDEGNCEAVVLRDAAATLVPLLDGQRGGPTILKIDCEGSEYAIFSRLAEAGLAARFDVILMEWHRFRPEHDPLRLRMQLSELGYRTISLEHPANTSGMLYGFR